MDMMTTIMVILIVTACLLLATLIIWFIWSLKAYNYTIILRDKNNNRTIIRQTRGRIKRKRGHADKFVFWDRQFKHIVAPIPTDEAIEINDKGRKYVEGYLLDDREIKWIKDTKNSESLAKEVETLHPLTQEQRILHLHHYKRSQGMKGFQWSQWLPTIASMAFVLVIIISFLIFFGDVVEPVNEAIKNANNMQKTNTEFIKEVKDLKYMIQTLNDDEDLEGGTK